MALHLPCRKTGNHDWTYGAQAQWCNLCWLTKPYPQPSLKPFPLPRPSNREIRISPDKAEPKVGKGPGRPNARAWREAEAQPECCYCEERFTEQNPPTRDHIIPISQGGMFRDGYVLACSLCNNARSCADYEAYVEAVELARLMALHEGCGFRRPKTIVDADGEWSISLATKSERDAAARERKMERRAARAETT